MYTLRTLPLHVTLGWTTKFILAFLVIDAIPVLIHRVLDFDYILIPWVPTALIGTALAFYLGFKTNASYDRLWEARKIWGAIVNESRTFAVMVNTYIALDFKEAKRKMILRHIAWLTALRFQLREPRIWEHNNLREDKKYRQSMKVEELDMPLSDALHPYLDDAEMKEVLSKKTPSAHILHQQMKDLQSLNNQGKIDHFRQVEIGNVIRSLFEQQGKSERIKNFPFPRQYASLNFYYVWLFIIILPFGMIGEFERLGENYVWLNIPFCMIISWVFYTMEMIGDYSENPFESSFNDIPITSLSRNIEIDILQMIDENHIPEPRPLINNVMF